MRWRGVIEQYRDWLPPRTSVEPITLLEGGTPLVEAERLAVAIDLPGTLWLKIEGANPTGSFKDRGMTVAMTAAVQSGARAVICASTGNTSASAAAYAALAGLDAFVVIPEGKIAAGKLSQAVMHGAKVIAVEGSFDDAMTVVTAVADSASVTLVNSTNPFRIEGQKTAAFEICDTLGRAPDFHALPVGNGGNISAYWKGYSEYHRQHVTTSRPIMLGFQAEGAAPLVVGARVEHPETVATAIRIGDPVNWETAVVARDESRGRFQSVTDHEILDAQRLIASITGVFVEPASAAPIAGLRKLAAENVIPNGATVVCTLTGHGLKDPAAAMRCAPEPLRAPADADAVRSLIGC